MSRDRLEITVRADEKLIDVDYQIMGNCVLKSLTEKFSGPAYGTHAQHCDPASMSPIKLPICAAALVVVLSLGACRDPAGGGGADVGAPTPARSLSAGSLTLNDGVPIRQYTLGTAVSIQVTLSGASAVSVPVTISSSNAKVGPLSPGTCYLPGTGSGSSCQVIVHAEAAGAVTLTASAPGYAPASVAAGFGGPPPAHYDFGAVEIGAFPSATPPSTSNFTMTAQLGQIVTLVASLTGFDQPLNGVPILLQTSAGTLLGNPQCQVDSGIDPNHYCLYRLRLPESAPAGNTVTVTATVVGEPLQSQTWNIPTVTITTTPDPVAGSIVLQSLDGSAPQGMSTPLWAVLEDSSGVADTVVTLQASNSDVTINPGISLSSGAYRTLTCTLSSASPVCGFGVKGVAAGTVAVSASASPGSYTIAPLPLIVNAPLSAARVIRFENERDNPIWVGITSGTSNSYATSELISSIDPTAGGPSKTCGPSNPAGGCPRGSTCEQGGAYPNSKTTYFCYWDQPVPSNGYEIDVDASDSTSISISQSSYDPVADITWSGNFYPREGCTLAAGGRLTCAIADCGNGSSGEGCAPGTGGAPAVATLPEVTLQRYNTDYYDISIIGGANVATSFGPDDSSQTPDDPVPDANGYLCGTAGAAQAQGTLPGADWDMATHIEDTLVAGGTEPYSETAETASTPSIAYYQLVSTVAPRQAVGCASSNACTTAGYVCGYDANAIANGAQSDYKTSCGRHLAWLSANEAWALNDSDGNAAPFMLQGSYTAAAGNPIQFNQLFSCTAPTVSGYNPSRTDPSLTCGCTNWGDSSVAAVPGDAPFNAAIAAPSAPCAGDNTVGGAYDWTAYVLPTLAWMKASCPTCYTYPFDDMSSTFQCTNLPASPSGTNSVPYVVIFDGDIPGR